MDTQLDTSQLPPVPVMARRKFADLVGVTEDTVTGWINKGYLPVVEIGKYRLVNLALVTKNALEQSFYE
ncbi:hypothetical protein LG204_00010 [Methylovorus menthalis]|uniref:hypothetical protein n=1 Tax=Methylovorus menthalis TaxID=1002227 RepID=UPI001E334824|nr:hypothetical protein [Methylovorus menthalis]MCB4809699.1 hypothetical protein [Methylovorus menthalis]